jgi:hypothetical protein
MPGRVECWRANPQETSCLYPAFPPSCPVRSFQNSVSSTRHIARSGRISRTARNFKFCELFPESLRDRLPKPVLRWVRVQQNHHIVGESRIFHSRPLVVAGSLLCSFQHPIDFIEIDGAEQWRNLSAAAQIVMANSITFALTRPLCSAYFCET